MKKRRILIVAEGFNEPRMAIQIIGYIKDNNSDYEIATVDTVEEAEKICEEKDGPDVVYFLSPSMEKAAQKIKDMPRCLFMEVYVFVSFVPMWKNLPFRRPEGWDPERDTIPVSRADSAGL